jgi:thiamine-monophosphate kinase
MKGEFAFIKDLMRLLPVSGPGLRLGIGDDCAVLEPPAGPLLVTTDSLVEGVHFRRDLQNLASVGRKAVRVSVSDIAAMGGRPWCLFSSVSLPADLSDEDATALATGIATACRELDVFVAGGNTTRSPSGLTLDLTVLGTMQPGCAPLTRAGAKAGDLLAVTGSLGGAAGGLAFLLGQAPQYAPAAELRALWREGRARVPEGLALAAIPGVHSMMDVSDGLGQDLGHLCAGSGLRAVLDPAAVPAAPALGKLAPLGPSWNQLVLGGGEDYELLLTLAPQALAAATEALATLGTPLTVIGRMEAGEPGIRLEDGTALVPRGHDHFASTAD